MISFFYCLWKRLFNLTLFLRSISFRSIHSDYVFCFFVGISSCGKPLFSSKIETAVSYCCNSSRKGSEKIYRERVNEEILFQTPRETGENREEGQTHKSGPFGGTNYHLELFFLSPSDSTYRIDGDPLRSLFTDEFGTISDRPIRLERPVVACSLSSCAVRPWCRN